MLGATFLSFFLRITEPCLLFDFCRKGKEQAYGREPVTLLPVQPEEEDLHLRSRQAQEGRVRPSRLFASIFTPASGFYSFLQHLNSIQIGRGGNTHLSLFHSLLQPKDFECFLPYILFGHGVQKKANEVPALKKTMCH